MHLLDVPLDQLAALCERMNADVLFAALMRGRAADPRAGVAPPPPVPIASCARVARNLFTTIAFSEAELLAAGELVARRYAGRGYTVEAKSIAAPAPGGSAGGEFTFISSDPSGATVGTMTLRLDGPGGLLAEGAYAVELAAVRAEGRRVCELTRLAVDADVDFRSVLAALFSVAYLLAVRIHRATDVFVEVNPRHVAFYRRALGFIEAAGERLCSRVGAPSVLMRLETAALEQRLAAVGLARTGGALQVAPA